VVEGCLGKDGLVMEGRSWKRRSSRGPIVLGKTVLWQRVGLGKDGLVVEGWSWKRRSCRGRIVLGETVLWQRVGLGKDVLEGDA
jgi:hypothetical protein